MKKIYYQKISVPFGTMLAAATDQALILLCMVQTYPQELLHQKFGQRTDWVLCEESNDVLQLLRYELEQYFAGRSHTFSVPLLTYGTDFQQSIWQELLRVLCGATRSYKAIAQNVDNPKAVRAVGSANGANPIMIIIPCHRVIAADGKVGGFAAGTDVKSWLLEHEKKHFFDDDVG